MMKKIMTSCLAITIALSTPALAQSSEVVRLNNRIAQLENQIQTLSRAVFRGDVNPADMASAPAAAPAGGSAAMANMDIKISQLENQMQQITGQLEEQQYEISQLTRQLQDMTAGGAMQPMAANSNTSSMGNAPMGNANAGGSSDGVFGTPSALQNQNTVNTPAATADVAGSPALAANPDQLYEKAFVDIRDGNYDAAASGFRAFMTNYPDHALASNAQYWLAETHYVRADYTEAAKLFAKGYQDYPESSKTADNLLKLGLSLSKLGKNDDACLSFQQLKTQFPNESGPVMRRADQEIKNLSCG